MFAHARAATVAPASTEALPVSVRRKSRSAVRLCQAVRPENSDPDDVTSEASAVAGSGAEDSLTPASSREFYTERFVVLLPATLNRLPGRRARQPFRLGRLHPHDPAAALPARILTRRGPGRVVTIPWP